MLHELLQNLEKDLQSIIQQMGAENGEVIFEIPKDDAHGDYATNVAMRLAKTLRKSPQQIATEIIEKLDKKQHHLAKFEVAGGGFINFTFDRMYLQQVVFRVLEQQERYGSLKLGNGEHINIEFVSANPTGTLHIGHGRGAAYGDSLARIYKKAGIKVSTEHYVNDAGNQIQNLTLSIYERYKELFGLPCNLGEDSYHGKEIIDIAKALKVEKGDYYLTNDWQEEIRVYGVAYLLEGLKQDLAEFNVEFDTWFSEKSLYDNDEVNKTLQFLINQGYTYEQDGAVWLKTTLYDDEKDRVLIKSDQTYTYIVPDIAYHANKLSRGFTHLIDVLGADHHGYINRLKAAIAFVGGNPDLIDVEILQMVRAMQNGQEIKMSKRSGKAITLRDMMDEVGSDALRFMYISKALSSQMDLDLDLAVKNSNDNPVYYVQYAYARICSLFRVLAEKGLTHLEVSKFKHLNQETSSKLIMTLLQYPSVVEEAAKKRLPHKISQYVLALAGALHSYYNDEKIISDNIEEMNEKLTLLKAVQIVLKDGLYLIGVGVKEKM